MCKINANNVYYREYIAKLKFIINQFKKCHQTNQVVKYMYTCSNSGIQIHDEKNKVMVIMYIKIISLIFSFFFIKQKQKAFVRNKVWLQPKRMHSQETRLH